MLRTTTLKRDLAKTKRLTSDYDTLPTWVRNYVAEARLFGPVSVSQIMDALAKQGVFINERLLRDTFVLAGIVGDDNDLKRKPDRDRITKLCNSL